MQVSTGFIHGYSVTDWQELSTFAIEAEKLGLHSIWAPEGWGFDGATPLAYLAAKTSKIKLATGILQVGVRTPANLAQTAMSLSSMSDGRFILGLGTSGPQVIEGFHGLLFDNPVARTRETIEVIKQAFNGHRIAYQGRFYQMPIREGQGKSLAVDAAPDPNIPIYIASLGPRNLELTGELADGWKGTSFMPEHAHIFFDHIRAGAEKAGRSLDDIDLQAGGTVWFSDDVDEIVNRLRPALAYQLGAMGSQQFNFYNAAYSRAGYGDIAKEIQSLWLSGKRDEARERVPEDLVLKSGLIGTDEMVKDRLRAHKKAGVTTLSAAFRIGEGGQAKRKPSVDDRLTVLARLLNLAQEVSQEVP